MVNYDEDSIDFDTIKYVVNIYFYYHLLDTPI